MKDNSHHATWYKPHYFSLNQAHRVGERWWGSCADHFQPFWAEPCLIIQFSFARPWLRITTGYRLRTLDSISPHIATVPSSLAAAKLLRTILADIKTFPISEERWDLAVDDLFGPSENDSPL